MLAMSWFSLNLRSAPTTTASIWDLAMLCAYSCLPSSMRKASMVASRALAPAVVTLRKSSLISAFLVSTCCWRMSARPLASDRPSAS